MCKHLLKDKGTAMTRLNFRVVFMLSVTITVTCGLTAPQDTPLEDYDYDYEYDEGYVELPDWMDIDLDKLSMDKISQLNSAKNLTELVALFGLSNDQLEYEDPTEIEVRRFGSNEGNDIVLEADIAGCEPTLEVVRVQVPIDNNQKNKKGTQYLPECVRLKRCGGCCNSNLLSCQPTKTQNVTLKIMKLGSSTRQRRGASVKYHKVEQVIHLECECQCRVQEHHCDKNIHDYKASECACVCKNRNEETECNMKSTHYWDHNSCTCRCIKTTVCSTGEEFDGDTCRCIHSTGISARIFNTISDVCEPTCVNSERKCECDCDNGWEGDTCDQPICIPGCDNGECVAPNKCQCEEGWQGNLCQESICIPGCDNGKCVAPNTCRCEEGWQGNLCQESICEPQCVNGQCVSPNTCECNEGWQGHLCQNPKDTCSSKGVQCSNGDCILSTWLCDGENDCVDGMDESSCCTKDRFQCSNGVCIKNSWLCDGEDDCGDGTDETNCCNIEMFQCLNGNCIRKKFLCDGEDDCKDGTDENNCTERKSSELYCGQPASSFRVVGGKVVQPGQYPWMALLGYSDSGSRDPNMINYYCGGSVVNERYVLTAAHCVTNQGSMILREVKLGEWDLSTESDCDDGFCLPAPMVYRPENVILHPKYNQRGVYSDDIALIRLNASVNIEASSFIHAVCLPEANMDTRQAAKMAHSRNQLMTVSGWGATESGMRSQKLLEVKVPLFNDRRCNKTYHGKIVSGQLCAGGRHGEDSCSGDSGGPLILPSPNGPPYLQVGVVSYGTRRCGMAKKPGVYTEVSKYIEWIKQNLVH